ncbi:MAG: hypothetical protein Q3988_03015 [Gemella sp.]|nr:hypothetical protein [Gemella sp.]
MKDTLKEVVSLGKQAGEHTLVWAKGNIKKITKWSIVGLVTVSLVGGGVAAAYTYVDYRLDRQTAEAQTNLILKQAQGENITLKTPDEIKNIVAQTIGKDQGSIWFQEVELYNGQVAGGYGDRYERDLDDRFDFDEDDRFERNYNFNNQVITTGTQDYVYQVEAREKFMKYDLTIDAKTGKVLSSRVDNF